MLERAGVSLVGDHVRHIAVGKVAQAEISAVGFQREDIDINILSPSKVPVLYRWVVVTSRPAGPACPSVGLGQDFATLNILTHLTEGWWCHLLCPRVFVFEHHTRLHYTTLTFTAQWEHSHCQSLKILRLDIIMLEIKIR